jgi:hypothetical protein
VRNTSSLAAIAVALAIGAVGAAGPRFFNDDPIARDPETQDASHTQPIEISASFDFVENSFLAAGDRTAPHAVNVNTIDEVPDSSWFTNRAGRPGWTQADAVRGPDTGTGPLAGLWTIVSAKTEGRTPGLTIRDSAGVKYFIKFDPPSNPEMASGAEIISTKFFHAFGYHVPENSLTSLRRESLVIAAGTTIADEDGRPHPMRPRDVDAILAKAARRADGTYRVLASRELPGTPLGHFRYYGTRPDDPNDIYAHEHRRELRGMSVFAAWLNHDDSRSINTLDTLVPQGPRSIVRHHLIDFGSTLGSGSTRAQSTRAGNEFLWESRPTLVTMLTLGFYVRPWIKVRYPDYPAVGRFESNYFLPETWKPDYPNPAFLNARPEDLFWAARIAAAFTDDIVRAIVGKARFSDPRAADYVADTLIARRHKVLATWLNGTNPIVNVSLDGGGRLTFENAAVTAGVSTAAEGYSIEWSRFDNATGAHSRAGAALTVSEPRAQAPAALLADAEFVSARVRAFHPERPAWSQPLVVYFRRTVGTWKLVGLERNP